MSDAGRAYVVKCSPYRGARYTIHLMIGDVANDMHRNRFWMSAGKLAAKSRTSRQTALEALQVMCDDGFLHRITPDDELTGRPVEYEFLMPDVATVFEEVSSQLTPKVSSQPTPGVQSADTQVSSGLTLTKRTTKPTELDLLTEQHFETFYVHAYPRKVGRPKARAAFLAAVRRGVEPLAIIHGAERFRDDPNRDDAFTPHPTTWLHREGWNDPPLPSRIGNGRGSGAARTHALADDLRERGL